MNIPIDYLFLAGLIFFMNVVPAFMPPTWIVLAFFYIVFHLAFIPTVIIGAVCATLGRVILAQLSRNYLRGFLPKKLLKNYETLGKFFERNQKFTVPVILTYAFFPVSSNQVYIIAGLSKISLRIIAFSFLVGRLFSYSLWVHLSYHFSTDLGNLFANHVENYGSLIGEILGILFVFVIGFINWKKVLKIS